LALLPSLVSHITSITAQSSASLGNSTSCLIAALHSNQANPQESSYAQKRRSAVLSKMSEPVGMIAVHQFRKQLAIVGVTVRGGNVILKRWSDAGVESQSTLPRSKGYSCSLVFMLSRITRWSLVISFSVYQAAVWSSGMNMRFNYRMRRIIPDNSSCFAAIKMGDVRTIQLQISSGELRLKDVDSRGNSLLHVSSFCLGKTFTTQLKIVVTVCSGI
jgi:hypothetical protein